jgi:Kdo2-lipid IVA lauroyltransferase/acyltransferase
MKFLRNLNDRFSEIILFVLVVVCGYIIRNISISAAEAFARFLGDFGYFVVRYRRKIVIGNLCRVFPEKTAGEIHAIARKVYRKQSENIVGMLRMPLIKTVGDAARIMDIDPSSNVLKTVARNKALNKGIVFVSAHFGNWELLALCTGMLVHPCAIVVKPLKNRLLDREINRMRTLHGNRVVYVSESLREGLGILRNGGILSILGDQSASDERFYADFMGSRVPFFIGPAYFALKAGVPLIAIMCRTIDGGRYTIDAEEIDTAGLGSSKTDAEEVTRRYIKILERYIYRYPEEWLWLHDRWKRSRPLAESPER